MVTDASDEQIQRRIYEVALRKPTTADWVVIPTGCISKVLLNDLPVDISQVKNLCDFRKGVFLTIQDSLGDEPTVLSIEIEHIQNFLGFHLYPTTILPISAGIGFAFIALFCWRLSLRKVDSVSISFFAIAACLSLFYIRISSDYSFTSDVLYHLDYIAHIRENWLYPYGYVFQSNHPPGYYYIAALVVELNNAFVGMPERSVLRFLSWFFFLVFQFFGLLTLKQLGFKGIIYYSCSALFLLWPGSIHLASKINSETLYYALISAGFYYALLWYNGKKLWALEKSVICAGLALTVRTNVVIFCSLLALLVLFSLFRGHLKISDFFRIRWIPAYFFTALCIVINLGDIIFHTGTSVYYGWISASPPFAIEHFFSFKNFFASPFMREGQGFWSYVIKTSIFEGYTWSSPHLATQILYFALAIILYSMLPVFFVLRANWRELLPHALNIIVSIAFLIYFVSIVRDMVGQNFRYIYPILISCIVFFGKSQEFYAERRIFLLVWLAPLLVFGFCALSTFFFLNSVW